MEFPNNNNNNNEEEEEEESSCGVCFSTFTKENPLLIAPCGHGTCRICFERLLLHTNVYDNEEDIEDEIVSACPTRGRCPFCRRMVDMFELRLRCQDLSSSSTSSSSTGGSATVAAYEDNFKVVDSPLAGMVFVDSERGLGDCSIHFPGRDNDNDDDDDDDENDNHNDSRGGEGNKVPFLNFSRTERERMDDGNPLPARKEFERGYHYHEKSQTFRGTIDLTKGTDDGQDGGGGGGGTFQRCDRWEVIMQFERDFRFLSAGAIIQHRSATVSSCEAKNSNPFPMDGTWKVEWVKTRRGRGEDHERSSIPPRRISIVANSWDLFGYRYVLDLQLDSGGGGGEEGVLTFEWTGIRNSEGRVVRQVAESGVDLKRKGDGPEVGGQIVWTVDHPDYHRILWTRESKCATPSTIVRRFQTSPGTNSLRYTLHGRAPNNPPAPTYNPNSVWGNVFMQGGKVGLASYHFLPQSPSSDDGDGDENGRLGDAYISYEHPECAVWSTLDDGSPVPSRVPFVRCSYNPQTRTFRGDIPWTEVYGTTWKGSSLWQYEIVFDREFACIISGRVGGFGTAEHLYGTDLNYINAAVVDMLSAEVDASLSGSDGDDNVAGGASGGVTNESLQRQRALVVRAKRLRDRLVEQNASTRTVRLIMSALPPREPTSFFLVDP